MKEKLEQPEEEQFPKREKLQGKLLDYLMNLAKKDLNKQDINKIAKFDPEVSSSFLEFVKTHPENTKFPSDEVYFYLLEIYENDDIDIFGLDFLAIENQKFRLNDRLIKIYEKEKLEFYQKNPELLKYKKQEELPHIRAQKLESVLQSKMMERVKLTDLDLSDLL